MGKCLNFPVFFWISSRELTPGLRPDGDVADHPDDEPGVRAEAEAGAGPGDPLQHHHLPLQPHPGVPGAPGQV